MERKTGHNSTYPKGGVSCSKDSFVVNQTLVFQIKFCGKTPALRVAAKRYAAFIKTTIMLRQYFCVILFLCSLKVFSQTDKKENKFADTLNKGLQTDIYLHPLNSNTAYTLKKGQAIYAQSLNSLPLPSWGFIGITDWLTAEIDFLPLIGGLFTPNHLPVPSFNFRLKMREQNKGIPALAFETMYQYLPNEFDQADNPYFATFRRGSSWYNRFNASWKLHPKFQVHLSVGGTYSQHLRLVNKDSVNPVEKTFAGKITPDFSLGLDYRLKRISFHAHTSYGSTFTYLDNVPRKFEIMYGFRLAPFYKSKFGFFKTFRIEWSGFYVAFSEVKAAVYVPIFLPYFYWQWTIKNKRPHNST